MRYMFLVLAMACTTPDMMKSSAERNAREFTQDMQMQSTGVSCSARDSDADGDVSCTVMMSDGTTKPIECNYDFAFAPLGQASGCKLVVYSRGFSPQEE